MVRGRLLRIPCYRLMFFNGFIDILDIIAGSFIVAYLHLTGGVFCSNVPLGQFLGHLCWSLWMGATYNCVVLALNRAVEMVPWMSPLHFLFRAFEMHVLYFNIPWIIDEVEYNCSSRTFAEWKARGSVNEIQGVYFLTSGVIFVTLYVLTLIGMVRGKLLRIPCYRLMFFNGFVDIMDLLIGSLVTSYLNFAGVVFCTHTFIVPLLGHMAWSLWIGAIVNCVVLAFNRTVEMIPSMGGLRFLFRGKTLYMWMALCVCIMVVRPFVTRPLLYNSVVSAFIGAPVISDDMTWVCAFFSEK
ncbi:unnamed protein product [Heligmosomoides polygyrus]|uniref:7TM_GPCR_Srx domain-containing protein n=1 Tax=Heligmosomoides polygyrus TaxID=6339 RepID=A0A3P8C3K2_HELPZ|nr:unnamed protein product [Heligmosomoides polygyrus]